MTKSLLGFLLALQIFGGGVQPPAGLRAQIAHNDLAVNNAVTVATQSCPNNQFVYVTGIDWQASQDGTGSAQTNVLWTSTNFGNWKNGYSTPASANGLSSGQSMFSIPIRAGVEGVPVTVVSPAAASHTSYSVNVYYFCAP